MMLYREKLQSTGAELWAATRPVLSMITKQASERAMILPANRLTGLSDHFRSAMHQSVADENRIFSYLLLIAKRPLHLFASQSVFEYQDMQLIPWY